MRQMMKHFFYKHFLVPSLPRLVQAAAAAGCPPLLCPRARRRAAQAEPSPDGAEDVAVVVQMLRVLLACDSLPGQEPADIEGALKRILASAP